jgi:endo-1,4-beta-xylanase
MPSQRLLMLFACAVFSVAQSAPQKALTLRDAADHAGILIGTAVRPEQLSETAYAATLGREFNMVEPEDAMKWWVLHANAGKYDFSAGDRIVAFATEHRMKVRGHTLVWAQYNPAWLADAHYASGQLSQVLQEHIETVVRHYRGQVFAWDVVNEALDEHGKIRSSLWYDQPGIGLAGKGAAYIEQCFRWAHAADPDALLFYNEAGGEEVNAKSDAIYEMVKDFLRRGVPIHGVGLQMHVENLRVNAASVSANIARLTALGLQVHITELDIAIPVDAAGNALHAEDLQRQADIYRQIGSACLGHHGCTALQTWGFTDKYSWIGSHSHHTQGAALLFDRNYGVKPANEALRGALGAAR